MKRDIILEDATVGVFGLGETGLAGVDFLQAKNIPTLLFDDNPSDRAKKLVNNLGLDIHLPNSESDFSQLIKGDYSSKDCLISKLELNKILERFNYFKPSEYEDCNNWII